MTTEYYNNLNLRLVRNVNARLDVITLRRVIPQGTAIPAALNTATNCCWVNVWITTLAAMGVRLSATDAADLMRRITAAGSRMMSPLDMGDLVTGVNLPVTLIEYSHRNQVGWSIGTPNGPLVAFVNTGVHYQICLPVGSDLAQRFATPVTPTRSWSTVTKGKPRSDAARRRAETKGIAKATAGARKRPSTAGARKVKAVSTTTSIPTPVHQPGASHWWGRGGEPAVANPTHTKTFAQAASADRSLALQIAAEDRAIADSIEDETRRLAKLSLDLANQMDAEDRAIADSIEDETRRLAKLSLDLANQMDADARMARELSDHLNGL
jgi:hypothetical protein